jgi:DNA polymerase
VPTVRDDLARLLRQRRELGVDSWVFERLTGDEALAAVLMADSAGGDAAGEVTSRAGGSATSRAGFAAPGHVGAGRDLPVLELPDDLGQLRELAMGCTRCGLSKERTQVVFSDGNPAARVAVVGEAPGANEDRTGLPFVGAAGKLLDLLLATVDLSRSESVYICNVIKCRPPGNRNPLPDEIACCSPYLRKQIELVRPHVILAVGNFAAQLLVGRTEALGKLRGRVYAYDGTPLVVTYHPAALLRSPAWTRPTWEDLQLLRRVLDEVESKSHV